MRLKHLKRTASANNTWYKLKKTSSEPGTSPRDDGVWHGCMPSIMTHLEWLKVLAHDCTAAQQIDDSSLMHGVQCMQLRQHTLDQPPHTMT